MAEETPPTQKTGLTCSTGDLLVNLPCALLTLVSSVIPDVASAFASMLNADMGDQLKKNLKGVEPAPDPLAAFPIGGEATGSASFSPSKPTTPTPIPTNIIKGARLSSGWSSQNPIQLVARLKAAGCNLIGFEIMENIVETQGDIAVLQRQQIDKLIPFKAACDAANIKFEISTSADKFSNLSNAIITTTLLKDRYSYALTKLGSNIYVQPISGDAYSLRINFAEVRLFVNRLFNNVIQYFGSGVAGQFTEVHPTSYTLPSGVAANRQAYIVTDSPFLIAGVADPASLQNYALYAMSKGFSVVLYGPTENMTDSLVGGAFLPTEITSYKQPAAKTKT